MDPKRPLSEISHLFLSELRARPGSPTRPVRIAPAKSADASIDMTPEEFEATLQCPVYSPETSSDLAPETSHPAAKSPCASVVLSSHLAERSAQGVYQFAHHLASHFGHIALLETDTNEFALTSFELDGGSPATMPAIDEPDTKKLSETLNELSFDVERWLISLPNAKTAEARELLKAAPHWVLLTTADHEGVVATYRALKGLSELGRKRISLVVLDARDDAHADAVFRKLDAVSRQFLHSGLEGSNPVHPVNNITEHALLNCRKSPDQSKFNGPDHWNVIMQFLAGATAPSISTATSISSDSTVTDSTSTESSQPMKLTNPETSAENSRVSTSEIPAFEERISASPSLGGSLPEVIDLPADAGDRSILEAIVRQGGAEGRWVLCPISAPMCPESLLLVGRDQRLMLLAVCGRGLGQLLSVGQAHRWLCENTALIRMALPQLSIDGGAVPCIRLLIDHTDLSAEILQPLLQTGTVAVQSYRRVKWGAKTGLLLEAA